jgi:hypothetical protein
MRAAAFQAGFFDNSRMKTGKSGQKQAIIGENGTNSQENCGNHGFSH